jgi:hypothetical protein
MSSSSEIRGELVDVLGKVDGISPSRTTPPAILPGCAWPVRYQTSWRNGCHVNTSWFVLVALPNVDRDDTVDVGDQLLDDVADALWTYCQITNVQDWAWPVGQSSVPALRFTINVNT